MKHDNHDSHFLPILSWLLFGAGLGSLATYMLDPDRGRRRQALVRDRMIHARALVQHEVPKKVEHVQNKLQGVQHEVPKKIEQVQSKLQEVQQNLGLDRSRAASSGIDGEPTSPEWEIAHNDEGSLTGPTS